MFAWNRRLGEGRRGRNAAGSWELEGTPLRFLFLEGTAEGRRIKEGEIRDSIAVAHRSGNPR
jgi:hypothetical protein